MTILPDLLRRSAERYPERAALTMDAESIGYAQLESDSNRFARALHARGVRRGDRVALWLPKSPQAVVALYGIMKAGAAYVPVDPGAPPARLAYIARDCSVAGLVTCAERAAQVDQAFKGGAPMRAVWFSDRAATPTRVAGIPAAAWESLSAESPEGMAQACDADDLAYILYTSGSTGEPKGVMLSHRNALAFVEWAGDTFEIAAGDRVANHAPFHFDLSTFDVFAAGRAGATLYPVPPRVAPFPAALAGFLTDSRLTVWYCTPSTLVLLLEHGDLAARDLTYLRVLLFAGEVMPIKHLKRLMQLAPSARFANLFGPTETNVCTGYEVTAPPAGDAPLPVGVPSCGDDVFILDEDLNPVPDGTVGELWVSGPTVMHGYWGRPDRTEAVLRSLPGLADRAYRTGDQVKKRPDGNIEFIGRRDHQIKTRGYRVELGEIEAALTSHPSVAEAVALAIPDEEVTNRLRAVVVPRAGDRVAEPELRQHCATTLPRYMVPEAIDFQSDLPRTSSGKVDRRALVEAFKTTARGQAMESTSSRGLTDGRDPD